jgi:hypothetical protein
MKFFGKAFCVVLALITVLSFAAVSGASAAEVKEKSVTTMQYVGDMQYGKKSVKHTYKYSVSGAKDTIKVDSLWDNGDSFNLYVVGKKVTKSKRATVTLYYLNSKGEKVNARKYRYTVTPVEKREFDDCELNPKTTKELSLPNNFNYDYSFKFSDSKIAKFTNKMWRTGSIAGYEVKALKKGTTKVKVYLKKTKIGSFNITVKDIPTTISESYKKTTLRYNSHGSSTYMSESHINLSDIIENTKYNAKYSVEIEDEGVASSIKDGNIYATGTGKTTVKLMQKIGKGKKTEIDEFTLRVKKAKMNYVSHENALFYTDGIFGNGDLIEYLDLETAPKLRMLATIKSTLINNNLTGSHFSKKDYTVTFKSEDKKIATVSSKGVVTAKAPGHTTITYTIKFSDGSDHVGDCPIEVAQNAEKV